jgi:zinc transporter ZupT
VNTAASPYTAFFTEHLPSELTSGSHYLKDTAGNDILPEVESSAGKADTPAKPWGPAIGAAIVINLVTLSGVAFAIPVMTRLSRQFESEFAVIVSSFAAGALLSCAFNVLLFEASHLIAAGGFEDETAVTWRWATMILAGFLTSTCIDCCAGFFVRESQVDPAGPAAPVGAIIVDDPESRSQPVLDEGAKPPAPIETPSLRQRARLISGVLIGDFFHNLCDGMFVGAAFNACSGDMGWSVAAATVIHEVAQELSDYSILVSPTQGGLRPLHALALNFTSGLSVVIGVVIVLASDVSSFSIGLMLAFGGGVYIHIGATECMPRVYSLPVAPAVRLLAVLAFILGAVAIALVLLNHEHCSVDSAGAAGAADPHAGHNH